MPIADQNYHAVAESMGGGVEAPFQDYSRPGLMDNPKQWMEAERKLKIMQLAMDRRNAAEQGYSPWSGLRASEAPIPAYIPSNKPQGL
jgi:hypothetical protein